MITEQVEKMIEEIFENTIPHGTFLNKRSIIDCMRQSYLIGARDCPESYQKLKSSFEDLLEIWGDFGKYNSSREHMEDDWKKSAGLK